MSAHGHTRDPHTGAPPSPALTLRFSEYELDFARHELRRAGALVALQPTPLRVLLYLAGHRDRTVPRRELLDAVWPGVVVGDEALTTALAEARHAVGDDGAAQRVIRTLKGQGYRFVAEATRLTEGAGTSLAEGRPPWTASAKRRWALLFCVAAFVAGVLLLRERSIAPPMDLEPIRSLAVLPLEDLSGDPAQDYFAGAMTETLIGELAKLPGVRVISRTSVLRYAGAHRPLPDIARELDVDGIIEGTVLRSGDDVRISARLIDGRRDQLLWSERYDRRIARVLEIQSEVARAVASEIELALSPQQVARFSSKQVIDPRAQDAYFRALSHRVVFSPEGMGRSIAAFEEAIAIAPDFAAAHASLAGSLIQLVWTGAPASEALPRAKAEALRALELDDSLGDAQMALGVVLYQWERDYRAAERAIRRGRALGAADPVIRAFAAELYFATGRTAESLAWIEETIASAPLDLFVRTMRANLLNMAGRPEEALAETNRILAIQPRYTGGSYQNRVALEQLGRFEDVIRLIRTVDAAFPEHPEWRLRTVADEYERALRSGDPAAYWRAKARYHLSDTTYQTFRNPEEAAWAYVQLGSLDEAFEALELAYARGKLNPTTIADQRYAPLRSDPRFRDLARRMNLPAPER